jgi:hypothetical protein
MASTAPRGSSKSRSAGVDTRLTGVQGTGPSKDRIIKPVPVMYPMDYGTSYPVVAPPAEDTRYRRVKLWLKNKFDFASPAVVFSATTTLLILIAAIFVFTRYYSRSHCLPAPFIYLTAHDSDNIIKYSRDGCLLQSRVVWYGNKATNVLRGLTFGNYKGHEVLFVADSADEVPGVLEKSEIIVVGPCSRMFKMRPYITATNAGSFGSFHAYSVAVDKNDNVYASFQHTDNVVRFAKDTLLPMPFPLTILQSKTENTNNYINHFGRKFLPSTPNGTFVQFGNPGLHNITAQGIRSIAWIPTNFSADANGNEIVTAEHLWVANEEYNRVFIVDSEAREVGWIAVHSPVGMFYDRSRHLVFIGSKSKKNAGGGAVYAIDANTQVIVKTFSIIGSVGLMHPTGLLTYQDILYVAEQQTNVVVTFNITTGRLIRNVISGLIDPVEQIVLSSC